MKEVRGDISVECLYALLQTDELSRQWIDLLDGRDRRGNGFGIIAEIGQIRAAACGHIRNDGRQDGVTAAWEPTQGGQPSIDGVDDGYIDEIGVGDHRDQGGGVEACFGIGVCRKLGQGVFTSRGQSEARSAKSEERRAKREERISEDVLDHPGRCWTHEVSELGSADPVLDCADTRPPARARNVRVDKESIVECVLSNHVGWDEKEKEV